MSIFTYKWLNSVNEIDSVIWDDFYKNESVLKKYLFTKTIEKSKLKNINFHYLILYKNEVIEAIFPCFTYRVNLEILAGFQIKKVLNLIRKGFPNFFHSNFFFIGSPIATCQNHALLNYDSDCREFIFNLLNEKAKFLKIKLLIFKEIPNSELDKFKSFFPKFKCFESLPNSIIPIIKDHPYPSILRCKYKKKFRKAFQKSENCNYKWEFLSDYKLIINEIFQLYLNVYEKSKYKFEKLTLDFFKNISELLTKEVFILSCRDSNENLLCAEIIIDDKENLIPLYLGLNYTYIKDSTIYYNIIYRTLLEAEKRGKKYLILGQTSYEEKAYCGAFFEKLFLGIYSPCLYMQFFIKYFFGFLFPKFKKPKIKSINEKFTKSEFFTN